VLRILTVLESEHGKMQDRVIRANIASALSLGYAEYALRSKEGNKPEGAKIAIRKAKHYDPHNPVIEKLHQAMIGKEAVKAPYETVQVVIEEKRTARLVEELKQDRHHLYELAVRSGTITEMEKAEKYNLAQRERNQTLLETVVSRQLLGANWEDKLVTIKNVSQWMRKDEKREFQNLIFDRINALTNKIQRLTGKASGEASVRVISTPIIQEISQFQEQSVYTFDMSAFEDGILSDKSLQQILQSVEITTDAIVFSKRKHNEFIPELVIDSKQVPLVSIILNKHKQPKLYEQLVASGLDRYIYPDPGNKTKAKKIVEQFKQPHAFAA
jgi:hypothetical protein